MELLVGEEVATTTATIDLAIRVEAIAELPAIEFTCVGREAINPHSDALNSMGSALRAVAVLDHDPCMLQLRIDFWRLRQPMQGASVRWELKWIEWYAIGKFGCRIRQTNQRDRDVGVAALIDVTIALPRRARRMKLVGRDGGQMRGRSRKRCGRHNRVSGGRRVTANK